MSDVSTMKVKLIVSDKSDESKALMLPINVTKNHLSGDTIKANCVYEAKYDFPPNFYLLRSNVTP